MTSPLDPLTRRSLLRSGLALPMALQAALRWAVVPVAGLALTPSRADADDAETPETMEGPYFKPRSPERSSIRQADSPGLPFTLTGRVLSTKGVPVAGALLDVWQADGTGRYDLEGFAFRGHQKTAADGSFQVDTVVPGLYPGRTRHLHLKVQAPSQPVLTTQLFFPNEPRNRTDRLYSTWLRMRTWDVEGGRAGAFDFVVRTT